MTATARKMPAQRRHTSEQSVATPPELIEAVVRRFGQGRGIDLDLAASIDNAKASSFFDEAQDSLVQDWPGAIGSFGDGAVAWLNPPFATMGPWAAKCAADGEILRMARRGQRIIMLSPASVGANWFRDSVFGVAAVYPLSGRVAFVGHEQAYPKDLMLSIFGDVEPGFFAPWRWSDELVEVASEQFRAPSRPRRRPAAGLELAPSSGVTTTGAKP